MPKRKVTSSTAARRFMWAAGELEVVKRVTKDAKYSPDEPRDYHGRWDQGGGTAVAEVPAITSDEARGNSRPVSAEEFHTLAMEGKAQLDAMKAAASPPTGLDKNWEGIKEAAYQAVQQTWSGITVDTHSGQPIQSNADLYALTVKEPGQGMISVSDEASHDQFNQAMDAARSQFADQLSWSALGVFHDDDNRRIDIDPTVIVDSVHAVEAIGAYTHAVGGAYHFASGNGYFPPHVAGGKGGPSMIHYDSIAQWHAAAVKVQKIPVKAPGEKGVEVKYSPDEARDDHGRWTTTGMGAWARSLDQYQQGAVEAYIGKDYYEMNNEARHPGSLVHHGYSEQAAAKYKDLNKDLDAAIAKTSLASSQTVYRGMGPTVFTGITRDTGPYTPEAEAAANAINDKFNWASAVGQSWKDLGFVSTSTEREVAEDASADRTNGVTVAIQVPAGIGAAPVSVFADTDIVGAESELLLQRGLTYTVQSYQANNRVLTVEASR